jgi:hypothetical protein
VTITPTRNKDFFINVATSILGSAVDSLECYGLTVPPRIYVGFDRPPQDCCPELTAWVHNLRNWNGEFPETNQENSWLCVVGYAFDVTIRIGRCYWDLEESGASMPVEDLTQLNTEMYRDLTALYMGWIHQWRAGNVTELTKCDLGAVGAAQPYREGGCAGWEFTITVGVF